MHEKGYPFVIMAKGTVNFIQSFVKQVAGTFETDRKWWDNRYHVYGKTLKMPLFKDDEKDRYIHVYYNRLRAASEQEKFENKIDQMEKQYRKLIDIRPEFVII